MNDFYEQFSLSKASRSQTYLISLMTYPSSFGDLPPISVGNLNPELTFFLNFLSPDAQKKSLRSTAVNSTSQAFILPCHKINLWFSLGPD